MIAIGQLAIGFLVGIGQASTGVVSIGQLAVGLAFGLGQLASGYIAIGQFGVGEYVLAQIGYGTHVWDTTHAVSAEAKDFFLGIARSLGIPGLPE